MTIFDEIKTSVTGSSAIQRMTHRTNVIQCHQLVRRLWKKSDWFVCFTSLIDAAALSSRTTENQRQARTLFHNSGNKINDGAALLHTMNCCAGAALNDKINTIRCAVQFCELGSELCCTLMENSAPYLWQFSCLIRVEMQYVLCN